MMNKKGEMHPLKRIGLCIVAVIGVIVLIIGVSNDDSKNYPIEEEVPWKCIERDCNCTPWWKYHQKSTIFPDIAIEEAYHLLDSEAYCTGYCVATNSEVVDIDRQGNGLVCTCRSITQEEVK